MATSSCTGALHLGLRASGIGPGDEVIIGDINWIASAAPVTYLGAKPVFVDVSADSWCVDPAVIEAAITPATRAIIVVHLYGNLAELDAILAIAKKHQLLVVEDAAEALGSEYRGRRAGTIGDFGVFSFHGTKTVSTGEGGMFVTNDEKLFATAGMLADHGRDPAIRKKYWAEQIGFKYRMSNLQAAMGLAQIERAAELVSRKRSIFARYQERLSELDDLALNPEPSHTSNSYWMPTAVFGESWNLDRDALCTALDQLNIDLRPFFHPLSALPMFENVPENRVAFSISPRGVNLPSYHDMGDDDIDYVASAITSWLRA